MTEQEIKDLKAKNVTEFLKMDRDAGNVIKELLYELEVKEDVYIELYDPEPGGMLVFYRVKEGDPDEVLAWAETLGFTDYDSVKLEV